MTAIESDSDSGLSDPPPDSEPDPPPKQKRGRPKKDSNPQRPSKEKITALISQLQTALVETDWNEAANSLKPDNDGGIDPLILLAKKLEAVQAYDPQTFAFVTQFDLAEPQSYEAAMDSAQAERWAEAICREWDCLIKNGTWIEVQESELPPGTPVLSGKWVFKLKRNVNGEVIRYKARWVVRGFEQQYGINYDQTFAAVIKPMAFRVLFAIAAFKNLNIDQMNVETAFLYSLIDKVMYVQLPPGYKKPGVVCKLLKALYGLKQSPRLWYQELSTVLVKKLGLRQLHADHRIFVSESGIDGPIISVWVDDLNIFTPAGSPYMQKVKRELSFAFKMVDMGPIQFYLGLKVERNRTNRTIKLSQPAYIEKIAEKFFLQAAKIAKVPMKHGNLVANGKQAAFEEIKHFQEMVGTIMFAMIETRPDIAISTSLCSRFAQNPSKAHIQAVKDIIRYLIGSRTRGITFGGGTLEILGYSDSDWGGDREGRKSTTGYIFMMNNGPVSWSSKKQTTVALSSTEAEYMALTQAAKEATWLRLLMTELGLLGTDSQHAKILVKADNQGSIALANNPVYHARSKHIDIQHHYVRNEVLEGRIELSYIPTEDMIADGLTKPLVPVKFFNFLKQMGMLETDSPQALLKNGPERRSSMGKNKSG